MIKLWQKNKIFLIFLLIVIFILPTALANDSLSSSHLICIGIAVDKNEDGYELSTQVVIPEQTTTFKQKLQVFSSTGQSLKLCVDNLNMHLGKVTALAHCSYMVVNEALLEEDLMSVLDYLVREFNIDFNCVVVATDKKAKDILVLSGELNNTQGMDLPTILDYNNTYLFSRSPNIDMVYSSFLGGSPNYILSVFTTAKEPNEGIDTKGQVQSASSGGGSQGSGGGASGAEEEKDTVLVNNGDIILMEKGKKIGKLNINEAYGLRYINPDNKKFKISVEDFTDDFYTNADIELTSNDKLQYNRYYIKDGVPILELNILQYMEICGIKQEEIKPDLYTANKERFTKDLANKVQEQITNEIISSVAMLQNANCDAIYAYDGFEKYAYRDFYKFLDSLENKNEYFKYVQIKVNVKVEHYKE